MKKSLKNSVAITTALCTVLGSAGLVPTFEFGTTKAYASSQGTGVTGEETTPPTVKPEKKNIYAKDIEVSEGKLDPKFKKDKYRYEVEVPYEDDTIKIRVTVDETDFKDPVIKVDGDKVTNGRYSDKIYLDAGSNKIKVEIKDKDGNKEEYTITVFREKEDRDKYKDDNDNYNNSNYSSSDGKSGSKSFSFVSKPSVDNLKASDMLGRHAGHIAFPETLELKSGAISATLNSYDTVKLSKAKSEGKQLRMYYYNANSKKWVALSSKATMNGNYAQVTANTVTGVPTWYAIFAVNQPTFVDTANHWAVNSIDRLSGIGIFEGYKVKNGYTFKPNSQVSKAELSTTLSKILGVSVSQNDYTMYNVLHKLDSGEEQSIISTMQGVPTWANSYVAPLKKSNVIPEHFSVNFNGGQMVTRAEAGVFITNALKSIPGFNVQALNVRTFADGSNVPAWAVDKIDYRIMKGDSKGNLNPNQPISRAELASMLDRTLQTLGW
ncbi:S-layer homology domain-containing protein [Brevibacillus daliensis]|uniref:S-layer homology domain-containing protein n=1 Tax=Brevibacillus daliensis TaxID=2892995 RepID=UPI001E5AB7FE|nr:S-layer homology domain-containing protein [Brevibacillus daliensis]